MRTAVKYTTMTEKLSQYIRDRFSTDDNSLQQIVSGFKEKTTIKNEILLSKGEKSVHCYFVVEGVLRMFYSGKKEDEQTRYFATENTFGGGFASFINQFPSVEFVQSVGVAKLLLIDRTTFYLLVNTNPTFAKLYCNILEVSYSYSVERIGTFMAMEADERIEWVLKNQPLLLQKVPNKMIASYLGIKPQTFSRLLAKSSHK